MNRVATSLAATLLMASPAALLSVAEAGVDPDEPRGGQNATSEATQGSDADNRRSIAVQASDSTVNVRYETAGTVFGYDDVQASVGVLLSDERDTLFTGTAMLNTYEGLLPNFNLRIGARAYVALLSRENQDVLSLSPGISAAYQLQVGRFPLELSANLFFAPDILTFGSADRVIDHSIDVSVGIRDQLSLFGGYRYLQFDTSPSRREVDNGLHIGVRWQFE